MEWRREEKRREEIPNRRPPHPPLFLVHHKLTTSPIPPASPPPLLPASTIELLLAQLPIDLVMGLAHPNAKLCSALEPRPIVGSIHPVAKIVGADPTRVQLPEQRQELPHLALLARRRLIWVVGAECVQEGPCVPAERVDVGWTVVRWCGGGMLSVGCSTAGGGGGGLFGQGGP